MLGVSRTIYVNVDSPNLGFPYFNFLATLVALHFTLVSKSVSEWVIVSN